MVQGIVMYSGGLDSTVVVHLLKSQGLKIKALHFVLPFYSGLDFEHKKIKESAALLGVPLQIEEEGDEFIDMVKSPGFGFGKNANPCVDCRIRRLRRTREIMMGEGASFIATGEVLGQRPMSQRSDVLNSIETHAGVKGLLVRPLSAKLMAPTQPEIDGLIDREKLLDWSGRGRTAQLEYAKKFDLKHTAPAGGCLLTTVDSARRFYEFVNHTPEYSLTDFKLLAYGKHFRISPRAKFIIARNDLENTIFEKLVTCNDICLDMADSLGPTGIIRGEYTGEDIKLCGSLLARYSKEKSNKSVRVLLIKNSLPVSTVTVAPADEACCDKYRI
jgi:tRNA-uridine 2-sulfurtransferase